MKVGLFVDTYYPMVDGVINVVHNYAKRLVNKCDVTVYCPGFKDYDIEEDKKYPYPIVRCYSLPLSRLDYSLPIPALDAKFDLSLIRDNLDIVVSIDGVEREYFNEKEKAHMVDVRNLCLLVKSIRNYSFYAVIGCIIIAFILI